MIVNFSNDVAIWESKRQGFIYNINAFNKHLFIT